MATVRLSISGMTCEHCCQHVTEALESVPGVTGASVDLEGGAATVALAGGELPMDALRRAVQDAGYDADVLEGSDAEL